MLQADAVPASAIAGTEARVNGVPVVIIHATLDPIVPIEVSRAYAAKAPGQVLLHEVDDGHRLSGHLDLIATETDRLWRAP